MIFANLRVCPDCRKAVSNLQDVCENCGSTIYVKSEKEKRRNRTLAWIVAAILALIIFVVRDFEHLITWLNGS